MRVRWTASAAQDLYNITRFIRQDNPSAARSVAKTLFDASESLADGPYRGRKGRIAGTHELLFSKLPYIAVYSVSDDVVEILHFFHGAQDWP